MKERELQKKVIEACNFLGLRTHHSFDPKPPDGYPSLTIAGPNGVLFVELVSDKGTVSPQRATWVRDLERAGAEAVIIRPAGYGHLVKRLRYLANQ